MMLKIVALLSCALAVNAGVDYNNCQIVEGWYGDFTDCPPDHIAIGACGSGAKADCSGNYHKMECCLYTPDEVVEKKENDEPQPKACYTTQGGYGEQIECTAYQGITNLCTSGLHASCGQVTSISCCDFDGLATDAATCMWRGGDWGEYVDCGVGFVMQGYCGSGDRYDCDGESHQVKCCQTV